MPLEILTGARYPAPGAAPNVSQDIQNAVADLADNTIPRFSTTSARDAAYASWVANGGAMVDSLFCAVGTQLYQYRGGNWEPAPTTYQNRMMRAQRTITANIASGSWVPLNTNTNWAETDPWGMRGTGGLFTAPFTGWYQMGVTVAFADPPAGATTGRRGIRLNPGTGVDIGAGLDSVVILAEQPPVTEGVGTVLSGSHLTPLNSGNTAQVELLQNSGGLLGVSRVFIWSIYLGPNT